MQPYGSFNPMVPYFQAARGTAANVPQPGECGTYSKEMFREDFPQFCQIYTQMGSDEEPVKFLLPETMLQTFIAQANDSVLPSRWGSLWRYAAGLYVAHFSALYLKTYAPGSRNAAQAAGKASQVGMVKRSCNGGYYAQLRQQRRDSRNREMGNLECNPVWPAAGDNGEAGRNGRDAGVIFDNPIFSDWYTDTVDVYRVVNVENGNITAQERKQVGKGIPCRIYNSQKSSPSMRDTAAQVQASEKLACSLEEDIRAGDELLIVRGGALGVEGEPERYFAGKPQKYYDPVGGAMTGLEHQEIGLFMQEIVR